MSVVHDAGVKHLKELDLLGQRLTDELASSREEARVVSENLAIHSETAAEHARQARRSADRAVQRAAAIELTTRRRTRKPNR